MKKKKNLGGKRTSNTGIRKTFQERYVETAQVWATGS